MKLTDQEQRALDAYLAKLTEEERDVLIKATRITKAELDAIAAKTRLPAI